jgi:hypothetical protein
VSATELGRATDLHHSTDALDVVVMPMSRDKKLNLLQVDTDRTQIRFWNAGVWIAGIHARVDNHPHPVSDVD